MTTLYQHFQKSGSVSTDTRNISEGCIFFALKGPSFNGNKFASKAIELGASLAVIDEEEYSGPNTFLVDDVLSTLQDLAKEHRSHLKCPVIGLTGSNGKTTVKELLASVLKTTYDTAFTFGNLNNHIGVPLTILSFPIDTEMAIVEMGANHQKEIEFLCTISQPTHGLITNYGKAHLEGFGGVEGVIKGKSELYANLRENNAMALVNADDAMMMEKSAGINRVTFGSKSSADYSIQALSQNGYAGIEVEGTSIQSHLLGDFQATNLGYAYTVGQVFEVSLENIKKGIESYIPQNNRAQHKATDNNSLLLDAYNANPSSTLASLHSFDKTPMNHPKWVILGDMFELGEYAEAEHQKVVDTASELKFEAVICVGEHFAACTSHSEHVTLIPKKDQLTEWLSQNPPKEKAILLKGSRGMALESLVELL
ncbi:MAG: UDP-N-acetylmuramoyl-tripeptide--D-alanyl-D-alanine ligase [Schleiferiaceae bacterium]